VAEAAARGHDVVAVSRTAPSAPVAGVDYRQGSAADRELVADAIAGADAVVASLSPRGDMAGRTLGIYQDVADAALAAGARLIVIGGFNALRTEEGGPRFAASLDDSFPFKDEALEAVSVLDWLQSDAPEGLDWTFVSPAATFGAYAPGERSGRYRLGGEVSIDGYASTLSGADIAVALVDAIEQDAHRGHIGIVN
ncbi:MAG: NAD(P)H-binding protein, partial [Microbacteriaceae bacterium]|nr:NAD(P)H-binding protein [Microbacteriaceae bacterium]